MDDSIPAGTEMGDEELLQSYHAGHDAALVALVERHKRPLYSLIARMTEGREDAEEIFQETWFRAIRCLAAYRTRNFRAWLFRIGHNLIIDRQRACRKLVSLDACRNESEEEGASLVESLSSAGPDPAQAAGDAELQRSVVAAIRALPPEQREVFLLRTEEDLPFATIARIQGVSINTALARMRYALIRLRTVLHAEQRIR